MRVLYILMMFFLAVAAIISYVSGGKSGPYLAALVGYACALMESYTVPEK